MRKRNVAYSIRIEPAVTGMAHIPVIIHIGPLAPLLGPLLEKHPKAKASLEAADARIRKNAKKLPDPDDFGGL